MATQITITVGDGWRDYTRSVPEGAKAIGTVSRKGGRGALIQLADGRYRQCNDGWSRALPQQAVRRALQAQG